jgi:bifunctional pyridoxal-dependent enzyme with beta-cystathionase and maltose regulon repressor activities
MVEIVGGGWIADLGAMTCRNIFTNMVVEFEKSGTGYVGKVKDMPLEIFDRWAKLEHGEKLMKKAVAEAEEVFLRAVIERDIEEKG